MACISTQPSQSSPSYAKVTGNISFPKKDQAVIIDVIDDSQLKVYVQAISKLIYPAHIRFISRIANNRICIYVTTKEIADELIDKHKAILVNGKSLPIRPLISRNKRIIFSNVCPIIPHNVLEEKLKEWKIKPMSAMTFLRAGLTDQGFSHILSFRRQIFITPEDIEKLPESFQITYEDTTYWIYVSSYNISCFLCKKEGHIAKNCWEKPLNPPSVPLISSEIISNSTTPTIKHTELDHQQIQEQTGIKRPHPSTSSDTLSLDTSASLILKHHHSLNVDNTSDSEMYLTDASQTSSKQEKGTKHLKKRKQYQEFNSEEIDWKVIDSNLNVPVSDFTQACISAAELSVPKSSGIVSKKRIPWFNNECKAKIRAYKKAFRKYKKYKTEHFEIEYKKARAEARRLLKENQRNAWRQFTESINHQTPTPIVWKKIRSISNKSSAIIPPVIKNLNNIPISDLSDKCNIIAEAFAMNSSDNNHKEEFTRLKTVFRSTLEMNLNSSSNLDNDPINSPFTISELLHVISNTKNSSPGPDDLPNSLIRNLPVEGTNYLLKIFNLIWKKQVFPDKWREAIVIPIPKSNKDHSNPSNYRPISLTCNLCKVMEKIVNNRLRWKFESTHYLSPMQSGFRKYRYTNDHLDHLSHRFCNM
ncbi:hypothetical protein M0802_016977 [Mischocyttarus mexicanus]|nr:hypothetical protein M0802_016977 [Mischocyttarus mexicanus]